MLKSTKNLFILAPYILQVFPKVRKQLVEYEELAQECRCEELKKQAQMSLDKKDFHCIGGSVYALGCNKILPFITSFQTISDYLDNLCDRAGVYEEQGFRLLHKSMIDSLTASSFTPDYYQFYPLNDDGGYLDTLVKNCQSVIVTLPSYSQVRQNCLKLTELYRDLQVYKHLDPAIRVPKLIKWANSHHLLAPNLYWWEFAAATGSTLTTFALVRESVRKKLNHKEVRSLYQVYFPWISGLHILLDYLIDQKEDELEGDLNFITFYETHNQLRQRLILFVKNSLEGTKKLRNSSFHETVVKGLLAMYLSDPKVKEDNKLHELAMDLIDYGDTDTKIMYNLCFRLRAKGKL